MILALLSACTIDIRFPPPFVWEDSGWDTAVPIADVPTELWATIDDFTLNQDCLPELAIAFRTRGWADHTEALLVDSLTGRVERHPLVRIDGHPGGAWESYQLGPLSTAAAVEPNVSTSFACDDPVRTTALLSWRRGGGVADCVAWGDDLGQLSLQLEAIGDDVLAGCRILDAPL